MACLKETRTEIGRGQKGPMMWACKPLKRLLFAQCRTLLQMRWDSTRKSPADRRLLCCKLTLHESKSNRKTECDACKCSRRSKAWDMQVREIVHGRHNGGSYWHSDGIKIKGQRRGE